MPVAVRIRGAQVHILLSAERQDNIHGAGMPHIGGPFELVDGVNASVHLTRTDFVNAFPGREAANR